MSEPNESQALVPAEEKKVLTIGGDTVIAATAELPEDQKEAIRWLFSLAKSQGWNLSRIAKETDIDASTLHRIFTGSYGAKLDKLTERIERYRSTFEDNAQRTRGLFVETSISKNIWEAANWARMTKKLVFIYGQSQFGKTTAALEYMARNNHGATKYMRMPASAGVQLMMKEFARACYVSPNSCFENLKEYVMNALDDSHLVFIDELHQAFLSYQRGSAIKCLEVIREIHDRRKCGMVLLGTNMLESELVLGQHRDLLKQFRERGIEVQLPQSVPKRDFAKIAAAFGLAEPTGKAAELVAEITKGMGLNLYVMHLQGGKTLANAEKKSRMTWDHFVSSHDIVAKLKRAN